MKRITRICGLLPLMAALLLSACAHKEEEQVPANVYSRLQSVDKLVLASMTVSKMATIDDLPVEEAKGWRQTTEAVFNAMKIGKRIAAYSYDTYLDAYVDLSSLKPEDISVDETNRIITFNLPAIQTEFAGRDLPFREQHYRVTGLRSTIDAKERAKLKERMNAHLKEEVRKNDFFNRELTENAKAKGTAFFQALAQEAGYSAVVNFKN